MSNEKRPPHLATVPVERAQHPAMVQRKEAPFGMPKVPPPHPATAPRVVVQPKAVQERPPHPATVQRKEVPLRLPAARPPHAAMAIQKAHASSSSVSSSGTGGTSSIAAAASGSATGFTLHQHSHGGYYLMHGDATKHATVFVDEKELTDSTLKAMAALSAGGVALTAEQVRSLVPRSETLHATILYKAKRYHYHYTVDFKRKYADEDKESMPRGDKYWSEADTIIDKFKKAFVACFR